MSVSLVMLPVALALRVVMGKERFDSWVKEAERRIGTEFGDERELKRAVRKAGYDIEPYGGLLKTHFGDTFFFWERVEGRWVAIFSRHDDRALVRRLMRDVDAAAGRAMFAESEAREVARVEVAEPASSVYPTNFRDGALLLRTLQRFGVQAKMGPGGEITCAIGRSPLRFRPGGAGAPYTVEIGNESDLRALFVQLSRIDDGYKRGVQGEALATLRARIQERDLTIEKEEVLADESVVITLNIGR